MALIHQHLFSAMWLAWLGYWLVSSTRVKPTERGEPLTSRLLHTVPLVLAFALLWPDNFPIALLTERLYPWSPWEYWASAAIVAAGMLFSVWARVHLGGNWSGTVTIKQGHELVTTGPYAIVRHPIYTGLLLALVGTAMVRGEWRGVLAVVIATASLWRKLRLEERWMAERFGEQYTAYAQRVPALVPFWK